MAVDVESVLQLSRDLQRAASAEELAVAVRDAVRRTTGYHTAWVGVFEPGEQPMVRILLASGTGEQAIERVPLFPAAGDAMLAEILTGHRPVVVADARTDPRTNKELVERIGNRTIINVPLLVGDELLGALGTGSFAPEAPRAPTDADLENLVVFATQAAAALQRVQLLQARAAMQRQLQVAQRMESLAVLAGGVAHDFNNLLTVILSGASMARDEVSAPATTAILDDVVEAARRASQLTRQLLALGRRQALELGPLHLAPHLQSFLKLVRRLFPESIAVEVHAPPGLPQVLVDAQQLDQVILNLCVNARDAMPEGGSLRLVAREVVVEPGRRRGRLGPGRYVSLAVSDTGVGMTADVLEHVLEPFFTTKPEGQGTGLGLAVAAGIVEQHGGALEAESTPGVGSTFTVLLPVPAGEVRAPARLPVRAGTARGRERVLLAEDEPAVRAIAERVLGAAGYQVVTAEDGQAAVELVHRAGRFDLVILDAVMPRASGQQAWQAIRELLPEARVLLVSGHALGAIPAAELRELALPFLQKPFAPAELLAAVRAALDRPARVAATAGS